jgi:hypothetical protein
MVYPRHFGSLVLQQQNSTCAPLPSTNRLQHIAQLHTSRSTAAHVRHAPAAVHSTSAHTAAARKPGRSLKDLSEEQLAAVRAPEQHVRVIAGEKYTVMDLE